MLQTKEFASHRRNFSSTLCKIEKASYKQTMFYNNNDFLDHVFLEIFEDIVRNIKLILYYIDNILVNKLYRIMFC